VVYAERERRREDERGAQVHRPPAPAAAALLALQRGAGNQAVVRMLAREQLSTGADTDTMTLSDLKQAYLDALNSGNQADYDIVFGVLQRLSTKKRLRDDEDELLEETIFSKHKLFRGVTYESVQDAADFLARNPEVRPTMYSTTFDDVYGGAVKHKTGISKIQCDETPHSPPDFVYFQSGGGRKETDATGTVLGSGKRPPVCHKDPYNHMMRAWLDLMTDKKYTGVRPGASGYDDAHRELAWGDPSNLQPGHNRCNSKTAHKAVGGNYPKSIETKVRNWAKSKNWL